MKKALLILSLATFALAANAQFEIRPYAGLNFSNVNKSPDNTTTKANLGGQIGIGLMFGNRIYFNPQVAYFARSTEYIVAGASGVAAVKVDQKINGLNIPLLVGVKLFDGTTDPGFNLRVFAGPSVQFLTKTEFSDDLINKSVEWKKNQWGAQVGAGLDVGILFLDAAYEFGLSNSGDPVNDSEFKDIKNNTFYINAGVRLNFAS